MQSYSYNTTEIKNLNSPQPLPAAPDVGVYTSEYRSPPFLSYSYGYQCKDLPPFTFATVRIMLQEPMIRLGLAMRAGPICNAEFAYKQGQEWVPGIQADKPEVATYVERQLQRLWKYDLPTMLAAQVWGWSGAEPVFRVVDGQIEYDRLLPHNAFDVRALTEHGELAGVRFLRASASNGSVDLRFPKALWHAFRPEAGELYGRSILYGAYSPFWSKWMNGGALDVRELFMHKDAYSGVRVGYPKGSITVPDANGQPREIAHKDIARQIAEQVKSGGVMTFPVEYDQNGKPKWVIEDAKVSANPAHILQYPQDLDLEMTRGLEIPDEMVDSGKSGGAWAGKKVPAQAFYSGLDIWLNLLLRDVTHQLLENLVLWRFGRAEGFHVCTKPLAEQAMEQQGNSPNGAQPAQQPATQQPQQPDLQTDLFGNPSRMSLVEQSIGEGALQAREILKAARKLLRKPKTKEPAA